MKRKADEGNTGDSETEEVVNEIIVNDMKGLLLRFKDKRYDRATEEYHKTGPFENCQVVNYWSRDATGLKIWKDGKWSQVAYYSNFKHMILSIDMVNRLAAKVQGIASPEGQSFNRMLRASARAAGR